MKQKKVKKLTMLSFLVTFLLTGGIFAYWASGVLGSQNSAASQVTIGVGQVATTTVSLQEISKTQGKLVPVGFAVEEDETEKIIIVFDCVLEAGTGAEGAVATLVVSAIDVPHALLNINILPHTESIIAGGSSVTITVEVTLTEPSSVEEYNQVAGRDFTLTFKFEANI